MHWQSIIKVCGASGRYLLAWQHSNARNLFYFTEPGAAVFCHSTMGLHNKSCFPFHSSMFKPYLLIVALAIHLNCSSSKFTFSKFCFRNSTDYIMILFYYTVDTVNLTCDRVNNRMMAD